MAAKQGFLMYYSKGDAIGTRVSVRCRRIGRLSEVVVKRGSTVVPNQNNAIREFGNASALHTQCKARRRYVFHFFTLWLIYQ